MLPPARAKKTKTVLLLEICIEIENAGTFATSKIAASTCQTQPQNHVSLEVEQG